MEIFFIGSLLVALMIYVSTRIKKSAAQAFESETIETDEFTITKPEGFLHVINTDSDFAFEAYSKDFNAENVRQARIFISEFSGGNFAEICSETRKNAGKILTDSVSSGDKACLIESEETSENAGTYNFYKIIGSETNQKIYRLKISVLQEFLDVYKERVDEISESFRLK
jgi:hypothetical protein